MDYNKAEMTKRRVENTSILNKLKRLFVCFKFIYAQAQRLIKHIGKDDEFKRESYLTRVPARYNAGVLYTSSDSKVVYVLPECSAWNRKREKLE